MNDELKAQLRHIICVLSDRQNKHVRDVIAEMQAHVAKQPDCGENLELLRTITREIEGAK